MPIRQVRADVRDGTITAKDAVMPLRAWSIAIFVAAFATACASSSRNVSHFNSESDSMESPHAIPVVESGRPIPVGTDDRRGPLFIGLTTHPLCAADVYGDGPGSPALFAAVGPQRDNRGVYLFRYADRTDDGAPVFTDRRRVEHPFPDPGPSAVARDSNGRVWAFLLVNGALESALFDREQFAFIKSARPPVVIPDLPARPALVGATFDSNDALTLWLSVSDGTQHAPGDYDGRDPRYVPYDGRGIWRGGIPYGRLWSVALQDAVDGPVGAPQPVAKSERDAITGFVSATHVTLDENRSGIVAVPRLGNLVYYASQSAGELAERRYLADERGILHRHPTIAGKVCAYPNRDGEWSDVIVGGEGCLYYYGYTGDCTAQDFPIYAGPDPVLEQDAELFVGSLSVLTAVDWDGDGVTDIVAGNSEGRILFVKNIGTNAEPRFAPGEPIRAGGREICIQGDYRGSIQGPLEARWGYVCPTVVDWDGDGLLDIVMSDITGAHTVFLNRGTPTEPRLEAGVPLYCDGLPVHGTWRVQPAVALLDDGTGRRRMAYVALDDDDQFHLYRRIDAYNLEDIGKLRLDSGDPIGANFLGAGGTGRLKLVFADWNEDGVADLIVGTPRHGSVPDPETGLPQSLGLPGAAVLFLENVGSNAEPVFKRPELFKFRGEPIFLGQHACGPTVWYPKTDADNPRHREGLVVGQEEGRIMFYAREDLSP